MHSCQLPALNDFGGLSCAVITDSQQATGEVKMRSQSYLCDLVQKSKCTYQELVGDATPTVRENLDRLVDDKLWHI